MRKLEDCRRIQVLVYDVWTDVHWEQIQPGDIVRFEDVWVRQKTGRVEFTGPMEAETVASVTVKSIPDGPYRSETLVGVACIEQGQEYFLPAPATYKHLRNYLTDTLGIKHPKMDTLGFWTSLGRFVLPKTATDIARFHDMPCTGADKQVTPEDLRGSYDADSVFGTTR